MNLVPTVNPKEGVGGMNLQAIILRDSLKPGREIGVQTRTGIIEEKEVWKDTETTETTTVEGETRVVGTTAETTALIGMREGSYHQTDMEGESTAQGRGTDRKDMEIEQGTGRSIHQMKAGGTLATGEGGARGP